MARRVAVIGAVVALFVTGVFTAAGASAQSIHSRLANVRVPANCDMPAQRLHHGVTAKKYLPAQGEIEYSYGPAPMKVHMRRHGTQYIARYYCNAGGVSWPETIVLYDKHSRLIASYDLGRVYRQEHAQVDSWRVSGHSVRMSWSSYEGCCFDAHHRTSTLRLRGHKLVLR